LSGEHNVIAAVPTSIAFLVTLQRSPLRHCEEQSDEAIQLLLDFLDCFASLAMTG
jgi:hypothetical protein